MSWYPIFDTKFEVSGAKSASKTFLVPQLLQIFGKFWKIFEVFGKSLENFGNFGKFWKILETFWKILEIFWKLLKSLIRSWSSKIGLPKLFWFPRYLIPNSQLVGQNRTTKMSWYPDI
jgi:hypothetical protein